MDTKYEQLEKERMIYYFHKNSIPQPPNKNLILNSDQFKEMVFHPSQVPRVIRRWDRMDLDEILPPIREVPLLEDFEHEEFEWEYNFGQ